MTRRKPSSAPRNTLTVEIMQAIIDKLNNLPKGERLTYYTGDLSQAREIHPGVELAAQAAMRGQEDGRLMLFKRRSPDVDDAFENIALAVQSPGYRKPTKGMKRPKGPTARTHAPPTQAPVMAAARERKPNDEIPPQVLPVAPSPPPVAAKPSKAVLAYRAPLPVEARPKPIREPVIPGMDPEREARIIAAHRFTTLKLEQIAAYECISTTQVLSCIKRWQNRVEREQSNGSTQGSVLSRPKEEASA